MTAIRGRFAPSPTGQMHLGNAWTALLAWLQIRHLEGSMVLRIEDLDPDRSRPAFTEQLLTDLRWLGLDWDEGPDVDGPYGPYCQDERRSLYEQAIDQLTERGLVYQCYCTRAELHSAASAPHPGENQFIYSGNCLSLTPTQEAELSAQGRKPSLRLKTPAETITFTDGLYGPVSQHLGTECGDFIVQRSDGVHAYQLAVVVDDGAMRISHVLRGDDLLSSTPRQLLLYRLLGLNAPEFTHVPLLYGSDGHRLSKRQQDLAVAALRARGVSADKLVGYLAWKAGLTPDWRPFRPAELIQYFSTARLSRQPVVVDHAFYEAIEN